MNIETLRDYCLNKDFVTESFPFDEDTLVFKVMGKMFLLVSLSSLPLSINVKFHEDLITDLRAAYPCVTPGYHMNKNHWNTVIIDGSVGTKQLKEWIDISYELVVKSIPKKIKLQYSSSF